MHALQSTSSSTQSLLAPCLPCPHPLCPALPLPCPAGGHLSHGYQTDTKKISATSIFFEVRLYCPLYCTACPCSAWGWCCLCCCGVGSFALSCRACPPAASSPPPLHPFPNSNPPALLLSDPHSYRMDCLYCLQTMPYRLDESTGLIDYDMMDKTATLFRWVGFWVASHTCRAFCCAFQALGCWQSALLAAAAGAHLPPGPNVTLSARLPACPAALAHPALSCRPKLIVAGASAYTRHYDYPRMRAVAGGQELCLGPLGILAGRGGGSRLQEFGSRACPPWWKPCRAVHST